MLQLSYESAQLWSSVAARRAPSEMAVWGGTALLRPALVWSTSCALCALGWQDVFAVSAPARETQSSVFLEREVDSSEPGGADLQKVKFPPLSVSGPFSSHSLRYYHPTWTAGL